MTAALPRTTPRNASIPRSPACITRPLVRNTTAVVGITIQPAVHGDERSGECPVEIFVMRAGTQLCATPSLVMPAGSFVMHAEPGVMHRVVGLGQSPFFVMLEEWVVMRPQGRVMPDLGRVMPARCVVMRGGLGVMRKKPVVMRKSDFVWLAGAAPAPESFGVVAATARAGQISSALERRPASIARPDCRPMRARS